jgi:Fe2+ transport system protein FeoA
MPSLDQLRPGQRGRIAAPTGDDALVQRLMEMGLFEGEEVEVIALAPLGDLMMGKPGSGNSSDHRDSEGYDRASSRDLEVRRDERR